MIWIALLLLVAGLVSSMLVPSPATTSSFFVGALVLAIVWAFK